MKQLVKTVLKAQHWQVFIFIILLPIFISPLFYISYFIWLWFIVSLQYKIPKEIRMKDDLFMSCLIFSSIISLGIIIIRFTGIDDVFFLNKMSSSDKFILLFFTNIIGLFCTIYCIYFVARTLKMIELKRKVSFSYFFKEFLFIWVFPVGVWIIQPKINKIVENSN
jgi:hypothetical protein